MAKITLKYIDPVTSDEITCLFNGVTEEEEQKTFYSTGLSISSVEYEEFNSIIKILNVSIQEMSEENYRNLIKLFRKNNFSYTSKDEFVLVRNCRIDGQSLKLTKNNDKGLKRFYYTGNLVMKEVKS